MKKFWTMNRVKNNLDKVSTIPSAHYKDAIVPLDHHTVKIKVFLQKFKRFVVKIGVRLKKIKLRLFILALFASYILIFSYSETRAQKPYILFQISPIY